MLFFSIKEAYMQQKIRISAGYYFVRICLGLSLGIYLRWHCWRRHLIVNGWKNIPRYGRMMIYGNHPSMMDPLVIISILICSRLSLIFKPWALLKTLAAAENFAPKNCRRLPVIGKIPILRDKPILKMITEKECIFIDEGRKDFKALIRACGWMDRYGSLLIFPEGGRTKVNPGGVDEFREGIGVIAYKANPRWILPIRILGAEKVLPKGQDWPDWKKGPITINIGKPFTLEDLRLKHQGLRELFAHGDKLKSSLIYAPLTKLLREKLLELQ